MIDRDGLAKKIKLFGFIAFIPLTMIAGPLGGYYVGDFLMRKFNLSLAAMLIPVLVGFAAGMMETVRIIKRLDKMTKAK